MRQRAAESAAVAASAVEKSRPGRQQAGWVALAGLRWVRTGTESVMLP